MIEDFELESLKQEDLHIGVYLKISHAHSEILNYISKNFASIFDDPDIGFLKKEEFKLLLKHKYLNV